jgi:hypothetical protein
MKCQDESCRRQIPETGYVVVVPTITLAGVVVFRSTDPFSSLGQWATGRKFFCSLYCAQCNMTVVQPRLLAGAEVQEVNVDVSLSGLSQENGL